MTCGGAQRAEPFDGESLVADSKSGSRSMRMWGMFPTISIPKHSWRGAIRGARVQTLPQPVSSRSASSRARPCASMGADFRKSLNKLPTHFQRSKGVVARSMVK